MSRNVPEEMIVEPPFVASLGFYGNVHFLWDSPMYGPRVTLGAHVNRSPVIGLHMSLSYSGRRRDSSWVGGYHPCPAFLRCLASGMRTFTPCPHPKRLSGSSSTSTDLLLPAGTHRPTQGQLRSCGSWCRLCIDMFRLVHFGLLTKISSCDIRNKDTLTGSRASLSVGFEGGCPSTRKRRRM